LADINLILENSVAYNGEDSEFTQQARKLVSVATESFEEVNNWNSVFGVEFFYGIN